MPKIGRNQRCPCGSGKKFKHCHGGIHAAPPAHNIVAPTSSFLKANLAREAMREADQGFGKPIISTNFKGHKIVGVGNTVHFSKNSNTFPDFLGEYIKKTLGYDWGNEQIKKPFDDKNPIMQWYQLLCEFQAKQNRNAQGLYGADLNGLLVCYYGVAYGLYLLDHNIKLQSAFIERLKNRDLFQGAYFELVVVSCLIRAGLEVTLEDESDLNSKHCEYVARSPETGIEYYVEVKARSIPGMLGKSPRLKIKGQKNPTSKITTHLRLALKKPAAGKRIIFIDLNKEPDEIGQAPDWYQEARKKLLQSEASRKGDQEAYVFITNFCFHQRLYDFSPITIVPFGYAIPDFFHHLETSLPDWYRGKQNHSDLYKLIDAIRKYPQLPKDFDETNEKDSKGVFSENFIHIGEKYKFEDDGTGNAVIGEVSDITVSENEKKLFTAVNTLEGKALILQRILTDEELEGFSKYGYAFFGNPQKDRGKDKDIFEFYEWLVDCYKNTERDKLLELIKSHPNFDEIRDKSDFDIVLDLCAGYAHSVVEAFKQKDSGQQKL